MIRSNSIMAKKLELLIQKNPEEFDADPELEYRVTVSRRRKNTSGPEVLALNLKDFFTSKRIKNKEEFDLIRKELIPYFKTLKVKSVGTMVLRILSCNSSSLNSWAKISDGNERMNNIPDLYKCPPNSDETYGKEISCIVIQTLLAAQVDLIAMIREDLITIPEKQKVS